MYLRNFLHEIVSFQVSFKLSEMAYVPGTTWYFTIPQHLNFWRLNRSKSHQPGQSRVQMPYHSAWFVCQMPLQKNKLCINWLSCWRSWKIMLASIIYVIWCEVVIIQSGRKFTTNANCWWIYCCIKPAAHSTVCFLSLFSVIQWLFYLFTFWRNSCQCKWQY